MLKNIYFSVQQTVSYTVEIPDGMDEWEVANKLANGIYFGIEKLYPDLNQADWGEVEVEMDDYTGEVDITKDDVLGWIGRG